MPSEPAPTLLHSIFQRAAADPDRTALIAGDREISWGAAARRINALAEKLLDAGIAPGDRVLISGENSEAIPVACFGVHAAGAVAVPIAPDMPAAAAALVAADAGVSAAILDRPAIPLDCRVFDAREVTAEEGKAGPPPRWPDPSDMADILFTTGTTGKKKGVVLTHANIRSAAVNICEFIGNTASDIEMVPLPLSHSFGLGRLRCAALLGNTVILERGLSNSPAMLKRMMKWKATGLALVPSGFDIVRRVLGEALGRVSGTLRYIEIGSAPMRPETRDWLTALLPDTRICHHYGLTEASRAAFTEYHADAGRSGTVGRAAPNVTITVRGPDGEPVAHGEEGEIVVRGGMVMREYWRQPDLTARTLSSAGFRTGDIGRMDTDGYLYLLGRREDLINVGGRKVVPDEVEEALRKHPAIEDAACVPAPDPAEMLGQCVRAYVVTKEPVETTAVQEWLRQYLEDYKIPREVIAIERVPRTSSGKIQRQLLTVEGSPRQTQS